MPHSVLPLLAQAALASAPVAPQGTLDPLFVGPLTAPAPVVLEDRWQLDTYLGLPEWLSLGGHQRTRYESFDEDFRAGRSGSGQGIFTRTALRADATFETFGGTLEILDSRKFDTPTDLPLNTGIVNALDILQLNATASFEGALAEGDDLHVLAGRHTMDVGSRRFVARNRFRNTINAFTGLNALWKDGAGDQVRAFFTFPVQRLPRDGASLRDNDIEADEERTQVRFFGVHAQRDEVLEDVRGELYLFGLDEDDGDDLATRNREIWTAGFRMLKPHAPDSIHWELEAAYQTGDSRASSAGTDTTDLDHRAEFAHLTFGYRWDHDWQPRLELLVDWASGDDDPTDGEQNRFDTLFGARRFEFGPTGIFGAFARANLFSPGVRLNCKPSENTELMITNRLHYLASDRDAWPPSGLADPTGAAGDYVGNLAEFRLRWDPKPNLRVEGGVAHLFAGSFIEDAPNATTQDDSTYVYLMTVLTF